MINYYPKGLVQKFQTNPLADRQYRTYRNGIIDPRARWTRFFIFVDPEFNNTERMIIRGVASELQEILPCVKFWMWPKGRSPSDFRESYIHVTKSKNGCASEVGRMLNGSQKLELDPKCTDSNTILHEMIHALGLHHEQAQPDRDKYVKILWQNIKKGKENNFRKYDPKEVSSFGVPYNPKSIMQYSSKAFSANGEPTMVTTDGKIITKPTELQWTDIEKLKRMYNC
ncbi:unnamed protein product [Orchesella dallaii]|uniref:Metalloendopeptidase n=1 Tax=Orchesella dallaii TaxID=48710 RepID=A0ABP1RWS7_9HEXA